MKCSAWVMLLASAIFRLSLVLATVESFPIVVQRAQALKLDERQLQLRELQQDGSAKVVILPNSVPLNLVKLWREDACALYNTGFGSKAGIAQATPGQAGTVRSGVHQIWIQTAHDAPLQTFVGNIEGRRSLIGTVECLRRAIVASMEGEVDLAPEMVELSYLVYDETGAYYDRHIDAIRNGKNQRRFSFIMYLGGVSSNDNDEPDDAPWELERDGGALRIYDGESSKILCDVVPESGTLVVFSSTSVWHEVLPVHRQRICVVGWFNSYL